MRNLLYIVGTLLFIASNWLAVRAVFIDPDVDKLWRYWFELIPWYVVSIGLWAAGALLNELHRIRCELEKLTGGVTHSNDGHTQLAPSPLLQVLQELRDPNSVKKEPPSS